MHVQTYNTGAFFTLEIYLIHDNLRNGHRDMTPLHHACINEHEEAVDMLLTHGADPNKQDWDRMHIYPPGFV